MTDEEYSVTYDHLFLLLTWQIAISWIFPAETVKIGIFHGSIAYGFVMIGRMMADAIEDKLPK